MLNALKTMDLKKQLDGKKNIQSLLGELCHLFNNPLFISMSLIKKIKKEDAMDEQLRERIDKVYVANERMNKVLQKMLTITEKDSSENVDVKEFLK